MSIPHRSFDPLTAPRRLIHLADLCWYRGSNYLTSKQETKADIWAPRSNTRLGK
ncbi:hypothetical protein AVEN_208643-1, partial [Araneus ventricosus]